MTPEAKVKAKVKKVLVELGAYYTMPMGTGFTSSGVPDFIICIAGLFYGIECKANGGKPTALQLKHFDDIRKAGGVAFVVDETNVETLRKELLSYVKSKENLDALESRQVSIGSGEGHKVGKKVRVLRAVDGE
jgi:hypothetical protein